MKTYNLFISHSWQYKDQYHRLVNLLRERKYFDFKNYSVDPNDPIHSRGSDAQLRQAIQNQIKPCHVVIVMAGVYATYSRWIDEEIDLAKNGFNQAKPIIAIRPRGNKRISDPVRQSANEVVGWNKDSIVKAIRKLA